VEFIRVKKGIKNNRREKPAFFWEIHIALEVPISSVSAKRSY
jgi:hypothetical protein